MERWDREHAAQNIINMAFSEPQEVTVARGLLDLGIKVEDVDNNKKIQDTHRINVGGAMRDLIRKGEYK